MAYFDTRQVAAIAMFAALWGVLSSIFAPIVFTMFGVPVLCDMIGFAILALTAWWVRKFGAVTAVGLVATVVNFIFNPGGVHFFGFTAACAVFDVIIRFAGYDRSFRKASFTTVSVMFASLVSASVAGAIIGVFFMAARALERWGGVLGWAGLHMIGGFIGASIGIALIVGLTSRGVQRLDVKKQTTRRIQLLDEAGLHISNSTRSGSGAVSSTLSLCMAKSLPHLSFFSVRSSEG